MPHRSPRTAFVVDRSPRPLHTVIVVLITVCIDWLLFCAGLLKYALESCDWRLVCGRWPHHIARNACRSLLCSYLPIAKGHRCAEGSAVKTRGNDAWLGERVGCPRIRSVDHGLFFATPSTSLDLVMDVSTWAKGSRRPFWGFRLMFPLSCGSSTRPTWVAPHWMRSPLDVSPHRLSSCEFCLKLDTIQNNSSHSRPC